MSRGVEGFALGRLTQPLRFELNSAGPQDGQYNPIARYPDGTPVETGFATKSNRGRPKGTGLGIGHSADTKAEIVKRYQAGEGLQPLAAAYSTSVIRVREILVQAGVDIRPFGPQKAEQRSEDMPQKSIALDEQMVCDLYQSGRTQAWLARRFHVAKSRIREVLVAHNMDIRGRGQATPSEPAHLDDSDMTESMVPETAEPETRPQGEPMPNKLDESDIERLGELHRQNKSTHHIARELGVSANAVRYQLNKLKAEEKAKKGHLSNEIPLDDAAVRMIHDRYMAGESLDELYRKRVYTVAPETVKRHFKRLGLTFPRPSIADLMAQLNQGNQMEDPEMAAPEPAPARVDTEHLARKRARELHQRAQVKAQGSIVSVEGLPLPLARKQSNPPRDTVFGESLVVGTVNAMPVAQMVGKLVDELNTIPGVTASFSFSYHMSAGA